MSEFARIDRHRLWTGRIKRGGVVSAVQRRVAGHIFTADPDRPYARPPLSKEYLRGETDDVDLHPSQWYAQRSIDLVRCATVEDIDPVGRGLVVDGTTHRYKPLVIACGAGPTPLAVPGGEHALELRSRADADRLRYAAVGASSVLIIGAGFIGCEAAASLAMRGLVVTVVAPDAAPQTQRLGSEAGERLPGLLHEVGVRYVGGVEVEAIREDAVVLDNGTTMDAAVEHWQDAVDQGAVAGANAAGRDATWDGAPGFWTTIGRRP